MKKALFVIPIALCFALGSCSNQDNNVHIGGGVSAFIKDSAAFNRAFAHDLIICNFSLDGKNAGGEKLDPTLITDPHSTAFSTMMSQTQKNNLSLTIITLPENSDTAKLRSLSDKMMAYLKQDALFGGFKKSTINISADGQPGHSFQY
ncbi:MAG: hypothetical protein J7623_22040 [Chitinophaga sp.]|uniref:hypothetical protein n=1 Tax=Chitinophaga sp. TaxID=1869181 RepID=UPI001B096C2B|nr:hypothetical protein [Chitinophaga sp.]MBO9731336.1 hypothetical protein [Chitinophaga sp.]